MMGMSSLDNYLVSTLKKKMAQFIFNSLCFHPLLFFSKHIAETTLSSTPKAFPLYPS